jgi:hypothetical protein
MAKRILLVGHCNVDGPRLQQEVSSLVRGAEVVRVNSDADLRQQCDQGADLLLVNREPLGFQDSGLDLVKQVRGEYPGSKCILVSDYADAQEQAEAAGALPGFGKSDIGSPKFSDTVQRALG